MEYSGRTKRDYLLETICALNALIRSLDTHHGVTLIARNDLYAPPVTVDCDAIVCNPILREALDKMIDANIHLLSKKLSDEQVNIVPETPIAGSLSGLLEVSGNG